MLHIWSNYLTCAISEQTATKLYCLVINSHRWHFPCWFSLSRWLGLPRGFHDDPLNNYVWPAIYSFTIEVSQDSLQPSSLIWPGKRQDNAILPIALCTSGLGPGLKYCRAVSSPRTRETFSGVCFYGGIFLRCADLQIWNYSKISNRCWQACSLIAFLLLCQLSAATAPQCWRLKVVICTYLCVATWWFCSMLTLWPKRSLIMCVVSESYTAQHTSVEILHNTADLQARTSCFTFSIHAGHWLEGVRNLSHSNLISAFVVLSIAG